MIIKATFNDNDFTHLLEGFFKNFWKYIFLLTEKDLNDLHKSLIANDKYHEFEKLYKKTGENSKSLSDEDKEQVLNYIKANILEYINKNSKENYEYLEKNLEISFVKSVQDKWQNGEVIYFFTMADTYLRM